MSRENQELFQKCPVCHVCDNLVRVYMLGYECGLNHKKIRNTKSRPDWCPILGVKSVQ